MFPFSVTNDVIKKKKNQTNVETFAAIQTVKYDLRATSQTPINKFKRINFLRSPIDEIMCKSMMSSRKGYTDRLKTCRDEWTRNAEESHMVAAAKTEESISYFCCFKNKEKSFEKLQKKSSNINEVIR